MEPYSGDTAVIAKVGTTPEDRGLETEDFKAKFDEGLTAFVEWFNTTHKTEFEAHLADNANPHSIYAKKQQENWIAPTLLNGWTNFDDGSRYATVGYYKDAFGVVHIKGMIKGGTATVGTPIFILPSGYIPPQELYFAVNSNGAFGYVSITQAGQVRFGSGSNMDFNISNIQFRV